jgi:hypothetical protein
MRANRLQSVIGNPGSSHRKHLRNGSDDVVRQQEAVADFKKHPRLFSSAAKKQNGSDYSVTRMNCGKRDNRARFFANTNG